MRVLILPEVQQYFYELQYILYEKEYFCFLDTSEKYVNDLIDDIEANLHTRLHKPAPLYFEKYGNNMKYAAFRKSKNTIWYVFFETYMDDGEVVYLVRHIANNHVIAQFL